MRNQLAAISLVFFLNFFGYNLAGIFFSFYTSNFLTVFEISLIIATLYATFSLASLFAGKVVEQYGTVRSIRYGALLYAPLLFILALSKSLWAILLGAVLVGLGASALWVGGKTFVLRNFERRGEAYGLFSGASGLGKAVSGIAGGWLSLHYLLNNAFALGGFAILAAVLASFLLVDRKGTRTAYPMSEQWRMFRNKDLLLISAIGVTGSVFFGIASPLVALIVKSVGGRAFEVGLISFISAGIAFFAMAIGGRASDAIGRKPVIYLALVAGALSSFLLYAASGYWAILTAVALFSIFWMVCQVALHAAIGDLFKRKLALANAVFSFSLTAGVSIGALLAGILSFGGLHLPFLVVGAILLLLPFLAREVKVE